MWGHIGIFRNKLDYVGDNVGTGWNIWEQFGLCGDNIGILDLRS